MKKTKYKVAFIYRKSNYYMTGRYVDNAQYNFYFKAMKRNQRIEIDYVCDDLEIDLKPLNDKYDALIFLDVTSWGGPDKFLNVDKVKIPKIFLPGDCHDATYRNPPVSKTRLELCKEFKFDYYYDMQTENYFYKFWPKEFRYKWISWGIEKSFFENVKPYNERVSGVILNTGNLSSPWYALRMECNKLEYVKYIGYDVSKHKDFALNTPQIGDNYVHLIEQYQASIAAIDYNVCCKQIEIPAAGCLCFLQVDDNDAASWGFENMKNAVFINKNNYDDVMKDYIKTYTDKKWEKIAIKGREFVFNNYTNDILTNKVVGILDELYA